MESFITRLTPMIYLRSSWIGTEQELGCWLAFKSEVLHHLDSFVSDVANATYKLLAGCQWEIRIIDPWIWEFQRPINGFMVFWAASNSLEKHFKTTSASKRPDHMQSMYIQFIHRRGLNYECQRLKLGHCGIQNTSSSPFWKWSWAVGFDSDRLTYTHEWLENASEISRLH